MASPSKTYRPILAALRAQHWQIEQRGGRWQAKPPQGRAGLVHFSQSEDPHALQNTLRALEECGFIWPEPSKSELRAERALHVVPPPPPPSEPAPAAAPPAAEPPARSIDELWRELRERKELATVADEYHALCEESARAAQVDVAAAARERDKAIKALREAKAAFDLAFEAKP